MKRPTQMPMALDLPAAYTRASFRPSKCNAQALALIEGGGWPSGKLVLTGPEGSGKTHLLHIWVAAQSGILLTPDALAQADIDALAQQGAVALDDADAVAGGAETALFHLHNLLAVQGGQLLLAARAPVRDWGLTLPDLASRLMAASHVTLAAPDDALLAEVLAKLFADRQITIPDTLIPFLIARMERSLAAAQRLVAQLDAEAMARKKPVSRALAADVMQTLFDLG